MLLVVFGVVVTTTSALGYLAYRAEKTANLRAVIQDAADFGDTVDGALHAAMLNQSPESMESLVERMEVPEEILDIAIYDAQGRPAFRSAPEPLPRPGQEVLRSHQAKGAEVTVGRTRAYRSFRPIEVSPECFRCHSDSDPIAGVIRVDLSLERGYARLADLRDRYVTQGLVLVASLVAALWLTLALTLLRPLRVLREGVRRVAEGDLAARVPVLRDDEVGDLARDFNHMADELQRWICEVEEAQEKLQTSIHRVAEALSSALDTKSIIQILLSESIGVAGFEFGAIVLIEGGSFCWAPSESLTSADAGGDLARILRSLERNVERLSPLLAESPRARTLYRSADMGLDALGVPAEWETVVLVPMVSEGTLMGHLVLASSEHLAIDVSQRRALEFLSTQGATAVAHSRLHEQARHMAITDGLTGLFDHRHFYEQLEIEMSRAARYNLPLSLILLDLDHFKCYNDRVGHRGGDQLLRRLAGILRATVRETDVVARYGGEEFAVILPHTGPLEAGALAERLRRAVEAELFPHREGQPGGRVTVSVGVASRSQDATSAETLVEAADRSLYTAKAGGRNRVVTASDSVIVDTSDPRS